MVKAVQAEDSISVYFDGLLKARAQAEVGLLIGKAGVGSRDLALTVVPTPSQDGEQVLTVTAGSAAAKTKKAAGKAKSNEPAVSVQVEADYIAEHALQVSRMLLGGVSVLGLYLFAPESGYSSCSSQLCSTLSSIAADSLSAVGSSTIAAAAAALTGSGSAGATAAAGHMELLLLHVDSSNRKFTMRSCQVSTAATANSTLKPCELKFGSAVSSLIPLRCSHQFNITLPAAAAAAEGDTHMQQLLQQAVAAESARVQSAVAAVAGQLPASSSQPIGDLLSVSSSSSSSPAVVDLYCLPHAAAALQIGSTAAITTNSSSSSTIGSSQLHGTVEAVAYVHKRDPVSKALSELKNDVISSLAARLQLLADESLAAADATAEDAAAGDEGPAAGTGAAAHPLLVSVAAGKGVRIALPRRVLVPWSSLNNIQVCDYLSEGEGPECALQRAQQLLQLSQVDASAVVELEGSAVHKPKVVAGTAVQGGSSSSSSAGSGSVCTGPVLAAAAAGLVAAVSVGVAYMSLGQ